MAHPVRGEVSDSHNAKLRRMTRHYGEANPSMNQKLPQEKFKIEGPEPHQGFGADYAAVNARSDKPARKALAANPVATYKRGGKAEYCEGGMAKRARGGRMKHHGKGATHVNVVVAPQGQGAAPPMAPNPQLAALAAQHPPMPPAGGPPPGAPPMGAGPMGPPPGGPPMMPRKRGGHVKHADEAQDKALIKKELKSEGLIRRADGGAVGSRGEGGKKLTVPHMEGGSISGPGREDKNEHWAKHGKKTKQEV